MAATAAPAAARLAGDLVLTLGEADDALVSWAAPGGLGFAVVRGAGDGATDLKDFLLEHAAPLPAAERHALLAALAPLAADPELAPALHAVREALRERLPLSAIRPGAPLVVHVDRVLRVAPHGVYVQGWCTPGADRLVVVSPEGARADLTGRVARHPRPDVAQIFGLTPAAEAAQPAGFVAYVELDAPSRLDDGWVVELHGDGDGVETHTRVVEDDPLAVRAELLHALDHARLDPTLRSAHLRPALCALQAERAAGIRIARVEELGAVPEAPELTVIVPLYGRIDLLEHQMVHFADDPEMREHELLYVLDSPELAAPLESLARQLYALYGLPFRFAVLSDNGGYSVANNLGASIARGEHLLLLNSDVIPEGPGWSRRLLEAFRANPRAGAVAPKLLFEDESIQHAGLYFLRTPADPEWHNEHFFKGLHRSFEAAAVSRAVPAVTAACLLTSAELYDRLGGLSGDYVQGDYEDTDFCLRLREAGLEPWYVADVELYHLEGQSYGDELRRRSSAYNRWLHTHRWDAQIAAAMEGAGP